MVFHRGRLVLYFVLELHHHHHHQAGRCNGEFSGSTPGWVRSKKRHVPQPKRQLFRRKFRGSRGNYGSLEF